MLTGAGSGNPLQYSCLENPMDRAAWWATVDGVGKSWTRLKELSHTHTIGSTVEPQYVLTLMLVLVFILLYHTWLQSHLKFFSHLIYLISLYTFLKWKWKSLSHVWLLATLWTVARQAALSIGFSRQEYWSGLLCPPSGDLPNPGVKPMSAPALANIGIIASTGSTIKCTSMGTDTWGRIASQTNGPTVKFGT